nr:glucosaminidase domain-containing protein [Polycladospora coralii]
MVYHVDPIYLAVHSSLETGNGSSRLARGVVEGYEGYYNMYGIKAWTELNGAIYAKEQGWDSVYKAILGGAEYIGFNYIHAGQDTLYKMRWNPLNPGTHQYATDIAWASKQANKLADIYLEFFSDVGYQWDIPIYK